jgi:hypothetical protein
LGLNPGETVTGFAFESPNLPGIVKCYVRPYTVLKGVGEELPEELHAAIDRVSWKIPQGITVGPISGKDTLAEDDFVRHIIQMVDTSVQQGWVKSPAVGRSLKRLANEVLANIHKPNRTKVLGSLDALLASVEKEKRSGVLLSESYALLKFNLDFLREKLLHSHNFSSSQ